MDFDFEDILKEFGISTAEEKEKASAPETPVPEEDAEHRKRKRRLSSGGR